MNTKIIEILAKTASLWTKVWINKIKFFRIIYSKLLNFFSKKCKIIEITTKFWFKMKINSSWLVVEKNLKENWIWEPEISRILLNYCINWTIFLDIWANIWYYSLLLSNKVWLWKIYSFEPQYNNYKLLSENIELNWFKNITPMKIWLGSKKSNMSIKYVPNNPWHSSVIEDERNEFFETEIIEIEALDNLNIKKVDLIKIDVEWYEYEVIQWMSKLINNNKPIIIIEFSPVFYDNIYNKGFWIKFLNELNQLWYNINHIFENEANNWELYKLIKTDEFEHYLNNYPIQSNLLLLPK